MTFARKRFGQHFLHDPHVIERIVAAIAPQPGDALVEIGPGRGAITKPLLRAHSRLDVIEVDRDLAAELRAEHAAQPGFTLHEADALRFDFAALAAARGTRLRVIGNLPYNISTPLLFHLLEQRSSIRDLHLMLQKEVIDRMAARAGTAEYGRLTVMLAPWTRVTPLFDVGPGAFMPPPRVWSAVARVDLLDDAAFEVPPAWSQVVAAAFSQRRKTLRNALRGILESAAIEACGVDPNARAETLEPAVFARLAAHCNTDR